MKKTIAILVILTLVFTMGCAGKQAPTPAPEHKAPVTTPSAPAEAAAEDTAETTSAAVMEIESELDALDDLDEDFLSEDLEALDSELDFEI